MTKHTLIGIAADHAGWSLKENLKKYFEAQRIELPAVPLSSTWKDLGTHSTASVDYPDYAALLAQEIQKGTVQKGILICGSGIGVSIAANRFPGVRAALVENPVSARLSREHNDANVLCLGARFLAAEYAAEILAIWYSTPFSGGERHQKRITLLA